MNKLKLYLIDYPIEYLLSTLDKIHNRFLNMLRGYIRKQEFKRLLDSKICDPYCGTPVSILPVGIYSPVNVVFKMLEQYFGFECCYRLHIHGIDVDTQDENVIGVSIRLYRPGLLIGKAGKDIYAIEDLLSDYFCKKVKINIVEVKRDVNRPASTDGW